MPLWANGHKDSFLAQASRKTASKLALLALGNAGGADGAASEPSAARQTNEVSPKGERSESMPRSQGLPGASIKHLDIWEGARLQAGHS